MTVAIPIAILGTVTINVDEANNTVLLNAYATWTASNMSRTITFQLLRDDSTLIATASDTSGSGNTPNTTAFIGFDSTPLTGSHSYMLTATATNLVGNQTITINQGTLTASEINT